MPSGRKPPAQLDREIRAALRQPAVASSPERYRVAYLVPNPRRGQPGEETMLRLWWADNGAPRSMVQAMADLRQARARGLTAWVADASGQHVPVVGASRPPGPHSVPRGG